MIQEALFTALSSIFVGRLYPLVAPETPVKPFGIYQRISSVNDTIDSLSKNTRIQIDAYATTYSEALTIASNVATTLAASQLITSVHLNEFEEYEADTKLYRVSTDFAFYHN